MASIKQLLDCIGEKGTTRSLVKDFLGYRTRQGEPWVPAVDENPQNNAGSFTQVSVLEQARRLQGKHFHLNVILVGHEAFNDLDYETICFGIQQTRYIFGQVGVGVGRVSWWFLSEDDAGELAVPQNNGDCRKLTNTWSADYDGIDLFVVRKMSWSGRAGPPYANDDSQKYHKGHTCDKDANKVFPHQTGVVARLIATKPDPDKRDGPHHVGNTFAHEMGHYFGLGHQSDKDNFMNSSSGSNTDVYSWQGDNIKQHCFMRGGC